MELQGKRAARLPLDDETIIELYWARDEKAIEETDLKYKSYLYSVAYHVLHDKLDCEECVNDTYLGAWNAMPPARPRFLSAFLAKITRRLSIDQLRARTADKRGGDNYEVALEEMGEVVSGRDDPAETAELHALTESIERFLEGRSKKEADLFISRYFFFLSPGEIAKKYALTESNIKTTLFRLRQDLKEHLIKEGFDL